MSWGPEIGNTGVGNTRFFSRISDFFAKNAYCLKTGSKMERVFYVGSKKTFDDLRLLPS